MAEPILQLIFQDRILETIKLHKQSTSIGRMSDNDIVINNLGVSRHHCKIFADEEGNYFVEDLDSANGVKVNGIQLQKSPLHTGDEIVIGKHKLIFQMAGKGVAGFFKSEEAKPMDIRMQDRTIITTTPMVGAQLNPPLAPLPQATAPTLSTPPEPVPENPPEKAIIDPAAAAEVNKKLYDYVLKWADYGLKLSFGGKVISVHAIKKGEVRIGRAPENEIFIDNLGVSRLHAKVIRMDNNFTVEDMGSANGIKVNGMQVKKSPIYPGDEILIGKHVITFDHANKLMVDVKADDIRKPAQGQSFPMETYAALTPVEPPPPPPPVEAPQIEVVDGPPPAEGKEAPPQAAAPTPEAPQTPEPEPGPYDGRYAVRVVLDGKEVGSYALTKKTTCVGRLKENDIVIDNLGVSRLHAKIIIEENGQVHIEDQESANGIIVDGLAMRRSPLYPGNEVIIVKHKLIFDLAHKAKPSQAASGGSVSTEMWRMDSTMSVSEADKEKLLKQWAERAEQEKQKWDGVGEELAGEFKSSEKPAPAASSKDKDKTPPPAHKKEGTVKSGKFFEPTPPMRQAIGRVGRVMLPNGDVVKIDKPEIKIGTDANADVMLPAGKSHHASITKKGLEYQIVAKTFFKKPKLNDKTVSEERLKSGDVIKIGDFAITFQEVWEE